MGMLETLRRKVRISLTDLAIIAVVLIGVVNALVEFWGWLSGA